MFQYEVLSETEAMAERFQLMKEGVYDAVITASQDTTSSKGNPMMDITLTVYDKNGKTHEVRDFLVFTRAMMWKVVHFAESANLIKQYEEGLLCSETAMNKTVKVKIGIQPGSEIPENRLKGKLLGAKYPEKNIVEDYIKKDSETNSEDTTRNEINDDIPF